MNVGYLFVDLQIESFILSILVKIIFIKYRLGHMGDYRLLFMVQTLTLLIKMYKLVEHLVHTDYSICMKNYKHQSLYQLRYAKQAIYYFILTIY